jgi:hypothetical protein
MNNPRIEELEGQVATLRDGLEEIKRRLDRQAAEPMEKPATKYIREEMIPQLLAKIA